MENQISERLVGKINHSGKIQLMTVLSLEGLESFSHSTQYYRHNLTSIFKLINLLGLSERKEEIPSTVVVNVSLNGLGKPKLIDSWIW